MEPQDFCDTADLEPGELATSLIKLLGRNGLPARIIPLDRVYELRDEIAGRFARRELDQELYALYADEFTFELSADFPDAKSIVIAAVPRPQTRAVFTVDGKSVALTIPPTYSDYGAVTAAFVAWMNTILRKSHHRAVAASAPYKLLAARSGLARYGRNNITFVPGLGSFFELVAAFTDVPVAEDEWGEPRMLDRCTHCRACASRCPTQAIRPDRFLLESARCLVFHNERAGTAPFPEWIAPEAHRTLIGCMECQRVCPENREIKGWVGATEEFSESETTMLLSGIDAGDLAPDTRRKLQRLDALRFLSRMPRNLAAALR